MKQCPRCGSDILDETRIYCDNCGYDLSDSEEHELEEEKEFVEGFSHNYPFLRFTVLLLAFILIVVGINLNNKGQSVLGIIIIVGGAVFGFVSWLVMTIYLARSKKNYAKIKK